MGGTFPSKVDAWLAVVLGAAAAVLLAVCVLAFREGQNLVALGPVLALVVTAALVWPCQYQLQEDHLEVRSGIIRYRVPYVQIDAVSPSREPWSSPALSLDRMRIQYGKRAILISPADREGFLVALAGRCPHLRLQGESLVKR
jgi:membrane protein YdbS with pleckstrin-like domain